MTDVGERPTEAHETGPRRRLMVGLLGLGLVTALFIGVWFWSAPRAHVPVPGPNATPEQVVRAYVAAINARDFATANVIDAEEDSDLGRFSRPARWDDLDTLSVSADGDSVHVVFKADFSGDETMSAGRQWWGYLLQRGDDGLWHIVDAGVA